MFNIIIGGDVYPANRNLKAFVSGNKKEILNDLEEVFDDADFRILNLECCLSDKYTPKNIYEKHILPSSILNGIKAIGADLVCLANNHLNDDGLKGRKYTLAKLNEHEISSTGLNNIFHQVLTKNNITIAIINVANRETIGPYQDSLPINSPYDFELIEYTRTLSQQVDHIVIIAHEGCPGYSLPFPKQQQVAKHLIQAGAKCIVYQSSHTIGAIEKYKNGTIIYGQGNFIFDIGKTDYPNWNKGFLVKLSANKDDLNCSIIPYTQSLHNSGVMKMTTEEEYQFNKYIKDLSLLVQDVDRILHEWEQYAKAQGSKFLANLLIKQSRIKMLLVKYKIVDYLIPMRTKKILLNYLECSHNNALLAEYLENFIKSTDGK